MTLNYLPIQIRTYLPDHLITTTGNYSVPWTPGPFLYQEWALLPGLFSGNSYPFFPFQLSHCFLQEDFSDLQWLGVPPALPRAPNLSYTVPSILDRVCMFLANTDFYYSLWHLYATQNMLNAAVKVWDSSIHSLIKCSPSCLLLCLECCGCWEYSSSQILKSLTQWW